MFAARIRIPLALAFCALALGCGRETPLPAFKKLTARLTGKHHFDHVVLIALENEDAATVDSIPYMDSLAKQGASLRDYYAVAHPSYPNYLALVAGSTFIGSSKTQDDPIANEDRDFGDAQLLINAPSIVDRLVANKLTWDVFAEDYPVADSMPRTCDFRRSVGLYARKHVPFLSFVGFHQHPDWCAHVRNLKWFRPDSLAAFTFIAPNMIHDGHDSSLGDAVAWLRKFLKPILADTTTMKSTVVFVTFDESATSEQEKVFGRVRPNLVYAALVGGPVKPGTINNTPYTHFSFLQMVEDNFGLTPALEPSNVYGIDGVWK
jgi:hypothetical protein